MKEKIATVDDIKLSLVPWYDIKFENFFLHLWAVHQLQIEERDKQYKEIPASQVYSEHLEKQ